MKYIHEAWDTIVCYNSKVGLKCSGYREHPPADRYASFNNTVTGFGETGENRVCNIIITSLVKQHWLRTNEK